MKKVVFVCMALLLALVGTGVAYAMWSDTIQIAGTVKTGSLGLDVIRTNGDDVFKDLDTGELAYCHWIQDVGGSKVYWDPPPVNRLLVAWTTSQLTADDEVTISYNNLFPFDGGYWGGFVTSALIKCSGTVPVHIKVTPSITGIPAAWVHYIYFVYDELGELVETGALLEDLDGQQLHEGYEVSIGIIVTVPQEDRAMNQSGTIALTIEGIQWNEYP